MIKLGVVGCPHGKITPLRKIIRKFSKEELDAIILTGDINSLEKPMLSIVKVLKILIGLKIPVYVITGSHESPDKYSSAMKKFKKNKYVTNCILLKNRRITIKDYDLVFLPGSTSMVVGKGGRFILYKDKRNAKRFKKRIKQIRKMHPGLFNGRFKFYFINSLRKLVKNPKKTILISHVPPKFNKANAIDMAKFGVPKKAFKIKQKHVKELGEGENQIPKITVIELSGAKKLVKYGYPVEIKDKNVGDKDLKNYIKKLKIKKFICSHIHEAGQKGNDLKGNQIKANKWSKELLYNVGTAAKGNSGIYIIEGDKAKYKNIKIKIKQKKS